MENIRKAALVAEIVGGVGVVLSLIFVGVQLNENGNLLAAQAVFDLRESNSLMARTLISDAELADMVYRGYADRESLSEVEKWRFDFWVTEVLTHRMTAWKYAEEDLLDSDEIESWQSSTCFILTEYEGARIVWDQGDTWLRADFRSYVEETCFGVTHTPTGREADAIPDPSSLRGGRQVSAVAAYWGSRRRWAFVPGMPTECGHGGTDQHGSLYVRSRPGFGRALSEPCVEVNGNPRVF